MRKHNLIKSLIVGILSILLVINISSYVFADDIDDWGVDFDTGNNISTGNSSSQENPVDFTNDFQNLSTGNTSENTDTGNISGNTGSESGNTNTELPEDNDIYSNSNENENSNENSNVNSNNNNSTNTLAKTGLEDNGMYAVVIVLGIIVATYSFRKVKEYNSL